MKAEIRISAKMWWNWSLAKRDFGPIPLSFLRDIVQTNRQTEKQHGWKTTHKCKKVDASKQGAIHLHPASFCERTTAPCDHSVQNIPVKTFSSTLWCMASFWLTSCERRISTSSLRTSSSSQAELSCSRSTLYAGDPGAPLLAPALPSRLCLISTRLCFSFLFSDSSSWRWGVK